jgi:hypothetical protein
MLATRLASQVSATRGEAISSINTAGTANMWIVKPTNNNRGNGIRVFNTFNAIDEHLKKKSLGTQVVVQKYIERPLLYKGRKFDIRQLVLVDNKMNIYVYKVCAWRSAAMRVLCARGVRVVCAGREEERCSPASFVRGSSPVTQPPVTTGPPVTRPRSGGWRHRWLGHVTESPATSPKCPAT